MKFLRAHGNLQNRETVVWTSRENTSRWVLSLSVPHPATKARLVFDEFTEKAMRAFLTSLGIAEEVLA